MCDYPSWVYSERAFESKVAEIQMRDLEPVPKPDKVRRRLAGLLHKEGYFVSPSELELVQDARKWWDEHFHVSRPINNWDVGIWHGYATRRPEFVGEIGFLPYRRNKVRVALLSHHPMIELVETGLAVIKTEGSYDPWYEVVPKRRITQP